MKSRSALVRLFAFALLAAAACGDDAPVAPDAPGTPDASEGPDVLEPCWPAEVPAVSATMTLGTGFEQYESMITDQELRIIAGPQGGFHVWIHGRGTGFFPGGETVAEKPRLMLHAYHNGEKIDVYACPIRLSWVEQDGAYQLPQGQPLILRNDVVPSLDGERIRVVGELLDRDGKYATDEREIVTLAPLLPDGGPEDAGPIDAP